MKDTTIVTSIGIGFIVGLLLGGWICNWGGTNDIEQLGQSICEEEYGMDYESYIDNTLKCKPIKETYDGIKVEIPKG